MSGTLSGNYNLTQTLAAGTPNVTVSGTINAYGTVGQFVADINGPTTFKAEAAFFGPASGHFSITNTGLIETQGTSLADFDFGILLGAAGTVRNGGTILGGEGIGIFQAIGNSYVENSKLIEGSIGVGVVIFGSAGSNGTVVNSGTIINPVAKGDGAIAVFGNGFITNEAGGALISNGYYVINGQNGPLSVTNAGEIIGLYGGINLQGGGFVTNSGTIDVTGTGTALSKSSYAGINTNFGGTVFNSGTILAQNGIYIGYAQASNTNGIQGYVNNSGLIAASSAKPLQNAGTGNILGDGIVLRLAGTVVNSGSITASNIGIYTQNGIADVQNLQNGIITAQIGIDLSRNSNGGLPLAVLGYVGNFGVVQAFSSIDINGNFTNGFNTVGVGVYLGASGTVFNDGTIAGNHDGIVIQNGLGFVVNDLLVTASNGYGIYLNAGGTVSNTGSVIGYQQGIFIGYTPTLQAALSAVRFVANDGFVAATQPPITETISGTTFTAIGTAIDVTGPGTIDNQANGRVDASSGEGIFLFAAQENSVANQISPAEGAIINAGTVDAQYGAYFFGIGSLTNSGTIIGKNYGIKLANAAASGSNSGLIDATAGSYTLAGTTTSGIGTAVVIKGGGSFTNTSTGTLFAGSGYGVYLAAGGSVNNAGSIIGYAAGLRAKNDPATIINTGIITATANTFVTGGTGSSSGLAAGTYFSHGVLLGNGRVTNAASGTITGQTAIAIAGSNSGGYILNAGHVTATGHAGLYLKSAGTIVNSGSVQAPRAGIQLAGGGFVNNAGTDSGTTGIYLESGGTVQNSKIIAATNFGIYDLNGISNIRNTGSITGANIGILAFSASSYVYNSGGISASNTVFTLDGEAVFSFSSGIALLSSGTVSNASAGVITGRIGIGLEGAGGTASTISNAGLVDGNYLGVSSTDFVSLTNSHIIEALGTALVTDAAPNLAGPPFSGNPFAGTGVALSAGGNVTNEAGATITGYETGVYITGSAGVAKTVINDGVITATGGTFGTVDADGITILDGGAVTNLAQGTISGLLGVYLSSGTVTNAGTISETGASGAAVYIKNGGEIVDDPGAVFNGVVAVTGGGLALASGSTAGTLAGFGTQFLGFVAVTVDSAAVWDIAGATSLANYITLTNDGTLKETGADALTISGAVVGAGTIILDPTTMTLDGSVSAGQVISFANAGDVLDLGDPSQFDGTISGLGLDDTIILDGFSEISDGYGNNRLTLTGASGAETLDIAGSFAAADFTVTTLAGSTTISLDVLSGITVSGSVAQTVGSGVTIFTPTLVSGVLDLTGGTVVAPVLVSSTLDIGAEGVISGPISLSGSGSNLIIEPDSGGSTTIPANTISGFTASDTIELAGVAFTGTGGTYGTAGEDTYTVATAGTLTIDADGTFYNLLIAGATIGQDNFVLSNDLAITETACYAAGTRIATAIGEIKVEDLEIGDHVETLNGSLQKIKWIGRRSYAGRFIAGNKDILPIRIAKDAIGEEIPSRDLFVSPGHAICIDGALIHAFRLVNGVSITQAQSVETITYYHIETENHEIIFAENCPAETFLDENFRAQFQNAAQFQALYPNQNVSKTPCLPLLEDGFELHAIQQRLAARAGILAPPETRGALRGFVDQTGPVCTGWAQDSENPEAPVSLDILRNGARIARVLANLYRADLRQAGLGTGCHAFRVTLPEDLAGQLEIRRATDGALLPWTQSALTQAA